LNIIIPRQILTQIDNNRGNISQQSFIINVLIDYFGAKNTEETVEEPNNNGKQQKLFTNRV
jgi:hypothetical protein